jgi:hypothetical protein
MDLGDYTTVKERGTRNNEGGTEISRGLDTDNRANVEIFSNSLWKH